MPAQVPTVGCPCRCASSPAAPLPCLCHPHPTPAPSPPTQPQLPGNAGLQQVPPVGSGAGGEGWDIRGHEESWEPDQRVAEGVAAPGLCPRPLDFWVGPRGSSVHGSYSSVCPNPCGYLLVLFVSLPPTCEWLRVRSKGSLGVSLFVPCGCLCEDLSQTLDGG